MTYNRDQWVESFEGQLQLLRPHMTRRVITSISNMTWYRRGAKGEDPIKAAKAESADMDVRAKKESGR